MDRPLHLGQLEISVVSSSLQLFTLHPTSCWSSSLQITPSTTLDFRPTTHRYTAIDWNNDFWSNLMFPESDNHQATDNNDHSCRSFQMETIHCSILEFDDITDDCGGIEVGSGIIESPYHPANYPNKANCLWYLRGNSASAIVLEFQAFVTENKVDYVSVSLIRSFRSNMKTEISLMSGVGRLESGGNGTSAHLHGRSTSQRTFQLRHVQDQLADCQIYFGWRCRCIGIQGLLLLNPFILIPFTYANEDVEIQ